MAPTKGRPPRRAGAGARSTPAPRATRAPGRGRWAAIGAVLAVAAAAAAILVVRREPLPVSTEPFPAPSQPEPPVIAQGGFVGAERCAGCHGEQMDAWRTSTHAHAGGPPGRVRLVAPFDGTPLRFADAEVIPRSSGGRYTFTVRQGGAEDRVYSVDGVVGGGHMAGGGTQGFLSRFPDGTWRFLPFDYSRQGGTWFCNTIARGNRGWVPISPALSLADCVDWPPVRVMGDEPRFSNCQSCHGSQIRLALDTVARAYRTENGSLGINCESCHGPGAPHLARLRDPDAVARGDLAMVPLAALDKDQSLGTCWQCHALKDQLRAGHVAGMPLETWYSIRLPQLGDDAHLPDGRVRTFGYQEGHLWSDCYRNGGMACTNCHDPHSQAYRDAAGAPIPGRFDDRQCTSCHASKADDAGRHTRHAAGSPGSRCTACHMPYLQEPELGSAIPYARSDHSIPIPRPLADSASGIVSACQGCHRDLGAGALDARVREWYGELKPLPAAVDALQRARAGLSRAEAGRRLLEPAERHTQALFSGMAWLLEERLAPDQADLERDLIERLQRLAAHPDDDVAALALASLHYTRGTDPRVRRFLIAALESLGDREHRVRTRWGVIMGFLADRAAGRGDARTAVALYRRACEADPRNARILLNTGLALAAAGDGAGAIAAYRESLAMDPAQPLVLVNLGIALGARNDVVGARAAYQRALDFNPREPLAWFNLAGLYARLDQRDSALAAFLRAAELDPSLAAANFFASRFLLARGDSAGALRQIEAGLRMDPSAADARRMRDELRARLGRRP